MPRSLRLRSKAHLNPEPTEAAEPPEEQPETAVSGETPAAEQAADEQVEQPEDEPEQPGPDGSPARLGPVPFTQIGPPNFPPRKPAPAKPDPGPRGRFGTISAQTRCANLDCQLGAIEAGFFVFSLARQWKAKRQHYLAGQCCCVRCAVDLHPMVAKRWEHFADSLAQSGVDPREIKRMTKGAGGDRPRRARRQAAAIEARG